MAASRRSEQVSRRALSIDEAAGCLGMSRDHFERWRHRDGMIDVRVALTGRAVVGAECIVEGAFGERATGDEVGCGRHRSER